MFFFTNEEKNIKIKPNSIEHAYLLILNDDLDNARQIFLSNDSPRSRWGVSLISILKGSMDRFPSYFEIRNFFEIDLDFLIKNEKLDYIELLLGSTNLLFQINQEAYKYVARVMFENNILEMVLLYLEKAKKYFYKDAELHFLISKYYYSIKDYENSEHYINECLKILPEYYPAKKLKNMLNIH